MSAITWWKDHHDDCMLQKLSPRLANLTSSSANIERLFSVVENIQGLNRTRFDMDSLESLARVKLNMIQGSKESEPESDDDETSGRNSSLSQISNSGRTSASSSRASNRTPVQRPRELRFSIATPAQQSHLGDNLFKCDRLSVDVQDKYIKFVTLIDFSLVKELREDSVNAPKKAGPADVERLLKKLRESRGN